MALEIKEKRGDGACAIGVEGEVDLNTSPELRSAILKAIERGEDVSVNLRGAAYMDSSGVATLVEGLKSANGRSVGFRLTEPSQAVLKVLQLARLDSLFTIDEGPQGEA